MAADTFRYASSLGEMAYRWDGECCLALRLLQVTPDLPSGSDPVSEWLDAYLARVALPLPPLVPAHTPFQARLRDCLAHIPPGETITYGDAARRLGTAPRAMGQALGANPFPLLVPCHRVVASNGGLGGFSCGLEWKRRLLAFESGTGG